jgi:hypothetical protein
MAFAIARGHEAAFTQDPELICLWFEQYREGLLSANDFKAMVADRITVMYMRDQAIEVIHRIASLTLTGFPLLC